MGKDGLGVDWRLKKCRVESYPSLFENDFLEGTVVMG